jgi:hypothetical protein
VEWFFWNGKENNCGRNKMAVMISQKICLPRTCELTVLGKKKKERLLIKNSKEDYPGLCRVGSKLNKRPYKKRRPEKTRQRLECCCYKPGTSGASSKEPPPAPSQGPWP